MAGAEPSGPREAGRSRWATGLHVWLAGFARAAKGFVSQPEPRTIGSHARGRQLVAGNFLFAGRLVEAPDTLIWELEVPNAAFAAEAQGSAWLDDLAAAGGPVARGKAQDWVWGWIERYGKGAGPGWAPELVARRLMRWINHAPFLLAGRDEAEQRAFYTSLAQQTVYLARRWKISAPGLPRFEALTGMICAGLALTGMESRAEPAIAALAEECGRGIDAGGGIPTRNPEELLHVLTLLTWAVAALSEAGRTPPRKLMAAVERIVPTLRALRHADGGLARFHGGGRGAEGRLDAALAASGVRTPPGHGLAMGFARLSAGRSSVIVDAAAPPQRAASFNAHASTLAFELTSGRRPLIVSCGSGLSFGEEWRRAGRATPSHSTLCLAGLSSARLGRPEIVGGVALEPLVDGPADVWAERSEGDGEHRLSLSHDGWLATHGLTCFRELALTSNGRALGGEDSLLAVSPEERRIFDYAMDEVKLGGIPFSVRFHLHPDADPELDMGGKAVSIALRSGEIWVFRHDGTGELSLEPSVYLEQGRLNPRPTQQIVLAARVMDYAGHLSWTLAKALDTPSNLRDVETAEPLAEI
jgi:uncharacterized heparinase superfamily protein